LGEFNDRGKRRMKRASILVLLVFSVMLIAFASALVKPATAKDPIIVGKWDRTDGADKYTIYANGTTQTVLPGGTYHGIWDYDGSSGYKYIFHWEHGPPGREPFIDYVNVAAGGQSYSGINNYGNQFHCVRVGGADSVPAEDSGFPIAYVAVGGGIAAIAVVGAAVYFFHIARGGAAAASSSNAVHREIAQSISNAVDKPQDPKVEKDKYDAQLKNKDLSTSEKNNTRSKAQNQPAQEDTNDYGTPLEQPDEPPDERTG
jgi:hypothetical protein